MSFPLLPKFPVHPPEELLEEYSFGRMRESALASLEEHLLVCVPCQIRLEEVDDCIALIRTAARAWEQAPPSPHARALSWLGISPGRSALLGATVGLALVCAAIILGGQSVWHSRPLPTASTVKLAAMRGGGEETGGLAQAPSGTPLDLAIDGATLPTEPGYRLEVVNQSGREVWSGVPVVTGTILNARLTHGTRPGVYWVRLYSSSGDLLREYGMHVQ